MDLYKAIRELHEEKEKLNQVIAFLEELERTTTANEGLAETHRGRKSMSAQERREVSERMRKYWASRRKNRGENRD